MKARGLLVTVLLISLSALTLRAQQPYTKTFSMDDIIPNGFGWSYWFIPSGSVADTLSVKMSCVTIGNGPHAAHKHNHHELFVLLEGEAVISLNGEERALLPGDGCLCPGGSSHSIYRTDLDRPIRYLMVNTETPGGLQAALPYWKNDYTLDDCFVSTGKKSFWYVKKQQTLNGLNVKSNLLKGKRTVKNPADGKQLIYVILEGEADIAFGGNQGHLPAMSVCYVPAGFSSTISSGGSAMRYLTIKSH